MATIAERILHLRESRDLTLVEFADLVGSTRGMVWKYENGEKVPSLERAYEWAERLGEHPTEWVAAALQHKVEGSGLSLNVNVTVA